MWKGHGRLVGVDLGKWGQGSVCVGGGMCASNATRDLLPVCVLLVSVLHRERYEGGGDGVDGADPSPITKVIPVLPDDIRRPLGEACFAHVCLCVGIVSCRP